MNEDSTDSGANTYRREFRKHISRDGIDLSVVADVNVASSGGAPGSTSFASTNQTVSITQSRGKGRQTTRTHRTPDVTVETEDGPDSDEQRSK